MNEICHPMDSTLLVAVTTDTSWSNPPACSPKDRLNRFAGKRGQRARAGGAFLSASIGEAGENALPAGAV